MPNMTMPNIGVITEVSIPTNEEGTRSATALTTTTIRVMCAAIHAEVASRSLSESRCQVSIM